MGNIYLIGMMGSGKSVTAKRLAALMEYGFVDLDQCIQEKTKRSIHDLFEKEGEPFFRDQEAAILKEVSRMDRRVVATGGGTILRRANVDAMKTSGKIIFLETSIEVLWERVKEKKDRPLLKGADPKASLTRILAERLPLYEGGCGFRVNTDGQTADQVARKIFTLLEKEN